MTTMDKFKLEGKRALVTGGSRGLGRAIAIGLADAGATVVTLARGEAEDAERLLHLVGDVSDLDGIPALVDRAEERAGGPIDLVVHAAGVQHRSPIEDFPRDEVQRLVDINLIAPYLLSQEIGRRQLEAERPGSHLFIASLTSLLGFPNISVYGATKSGVMGIVRGLSVEWAARGIRANAIAPGYFRTALTEALFEQPKEVERLYGRIPMRRFGNPEDLAGAGVFLLSDASAYMTGQIMYIDGGWTAS